jgi:hypothetical protein
MVNWGDVPTWVTAGAALLALIGAGLAYRYQAEQIRLQRQQLADQQEANKQQAQVIADATKSREREQANQIDVEISQMDGVQTKALPEGAGEPVEVVVVTNGSMRPSHINCRLMLIYAAGDDLPLVHS